MQMKRSNSSHQAIFVKLSAIALAAYCTLLPNQSLAGAISNSFVSPCMGIYLPNPVTLENLCQTAPYGGYVMVGAYSPYGVLGAGILDVSGGFTPSGLSIGSLASGTVNVSGGAIQTGGLAVGDGSAGVINIGSGSTVVGTFVGIGGSARGDANVLGGSLSSSGYMSVGNGTANGYLTISSGGSASSIAGIGIAANSGSISVVNISGSGSTLTTSDYLALADHGDGKIFVDGGAKLQAYSAGLGGSLGGKGSLYLNGSGSSFIASDNITVGAGGSGVLSISGGSSINSKSITIGATSSSDGTVSIVGDGSQVSIAGFVTVGDAGAGSLVITNKGRLTSGGVNVGNAAGSKGTMSVDGLGSIVSAGSNDVIVGTSGVGSFSVLSGGSVSANRITLGAGASGSGDFVVDGTGSSITTTKFITVGDSGQGSLQVRNKAAATAAGVNIGNIAGSTGSLTLTGSGSTLSAISGLLLAGNAGQGDISIKEGATGSFLSAVVGSQKTSIGSITIDGNGSTLTTAGFVTVGDAGAGSLVITNKGRLTSGGVNVGNAAGSKGTMSVDGSGAAIQTSGNISLGINGAGELIASNKAVLTSKSLELARSAGSTGRIDLIGTGTIFTDTSFTATESTSVGVAGSGNVVISKGAALTTGSLTIGEKAGSTGNVTVAGIGSLLTIAPSCSGCSSDLYVGLGSNGSIDIQSGANAVIGVSQQGLTTAILADQPLSKGAIRVSGIGSSMTINGGLQVGNRGDGEISITNSARVEQIDIPTAVGGAGGLQLALESGSSGRVIISGAGSTLELKSSNTFGSASVPVVVGGGGQAIIQVLGGGSVKVNTLLNSIFAANSGSSGQLLIDGASSTFESTSGVTIGKAGSGVSVISGGGSIRVRGDLILGSNAGGTGNLLIGTGSKAVVDGQVVVSGAGAQSSGRLVVNGDLTASSMRNNQGGYVGGAGNLNVSGTIVNNGVWNVGNSPGTMRINAGNFVNSADGRIVLEILEQPNGSFALDKWIFGSSTIFDFKGGDIEFHFLGNANPVDFLKSDLFWLSSFFEEEGPGGVLSELPQNIFDGAIFSATSDSYTFDYFSYSLSDGAQLAIHGVPEPGILCIVILPAAWLVRNHRRRHVGRAQLRSAG